MGKIEFEHHHELLSFDVRLQNIQFVFGGSLYVEMHNDIEIISSGASVGIIEDVWERKGDLNILWPLIGKTLERLVMDKDSFRLIFEDGTMIRKKYEARIEVVTFLGPGPNEFTRYPQDLDPMDLTIEEHKRIVASLFGGKLPADIEAQMDEEERIKQEYLAAQASSQKDR